MSKRLKVSEDTQINVTTTYKRNRGSKSKQAKTTFNWVIKGILISSTLVSSVLTAGGPAMASTNTQVPPPTTNNIVVQDAFQDEVAMISNLKMANKVLEAAIKSGDLTPAVFDTVMKRLTAVEAKIVVDKQFNKATELAPILQVTDNLVKAKINTADNSILQSRQIAISSLENVQNMFGITSTVKDQMANLQTANTSQSIVTTSAVKQTVKYNDYQEGQYWSKDMLWAIDKGLIQGYMNAPHPTNKSIKYKGNWLVPKNDLTEGQMISVVFRYTHAQELKTTKPVKNFSASVPYQLAQKYKVPTKGSLTNIAPANKVTTRGTLAQTLATLHYGKPMSMKDSVQFMYDADISSGMVVNGNSPKTYDSYGVNTPLLRSHIVSFMQRYDAYLASGGSASKPPVTKPPVTNPAPPVTNPSPPVTSGQTVNGIKVQYGTHTYGSKNQSEYNQVMNIINRHKELTKNNMSWSDNQTPERLAGIEAYFKGEKPNFDRNDPNGRTERNMGLVFAHSSFEGYVKSGLSKDTIYAIHNIKGSADSLVLSSEKQSNGTNPRSAYDGLINGQIDCDPSAYIISALYDSMGYTTAVLAKPGHAHVLVKVQGKWMDVSIAKEANVTQLLKEASTVLAYPTDGSVLK